MAKTLADLDATIPKANDPLRAQPIRDNFEAIKDVLSGGGAVGITAQVHYAGTDAALVAFYAPAAIPTGVLWFDSSITQMKIRIGSVWLNVG